MSFIRNAVIALVVAAAIPVAASAQGPGPGGPPPGGQGQGGGMRGAGQMSQMLMKDITLTDDQQKQIEKIRQSMLAERRAIGSPQPGMPPDSTTRTKMINLRKKQLVGIRNVLTVEQQKTFDANVGEMDKRMQEMRRN